MKFENKFWPYQLREHWRSLGGNNRISLSQKLKVFCTSSLKMLRRDFISQYSPPMGARIADEEKLTVIILNHKRPFNIEKICKYVLRNQFVNRVVVSNNCQDYSIREYVNLKDSRLVLLDQEKPSGVGIRFKLAQTYIAKYYLLFDDDFFLHPAQLQWVYSSLVSSPDRPHGTRGAILKPDLSPNNQWPFGYAKNTMQEVDILLGLFAFTRQHLEEYFRLCRLLGIDDQEQLMNGEDIIISFSGNLKPMIEDVGNIWMCASERKPGVALHLTRDNFVTPRWQIFSALQKIKQLPSSAS